MTAILIAAQSDEVRALVPWARVIALRSGVDLSIVLPQRSKGSSRLVAIGDEPSDDDSELVTLCRNTVQAGTGSTEVDAVSASARASVRIQLYQLLGDDWSSRIADQLAELNPALVIVPAPVISRNRSDADHWQTAMLENLDCEVMLIQDDSKTFEQEIRLAVILQDGFDNEAVLAHAARLTSVDGAARATAVYVEPNIGDLALSVGMRQLSSLLRQNLNRYEQEAFEQRVIVSGNLTAAVKQLDPSEFDLILTGATNLQMLRRFFAAGPASGDPEAIPALAAVRPAQSLSNRILSRAGRWMRSIVPQLARDERVDLVSRIQTSSQWDFDFIFLVSLATLIACLGLAENSGAVIVGAMLVAPLMTPIAGVGLGVAHGNSFLTRIALRTALRGFATAMLIGVLFGWCVQVLSWTGWPGPLISGADTASMQFPREMETRTHPQFYDLLIALASGTAAAYAMGRPNLFSALPGVAIAAALVPPIATSGIALAHGDFVKGGGALLLFVTNMVAIILGTSLAFRAVGVRSQKEGQAVAAWPRYSLLLLVMLSILVTVMMEMLR
ncbi:MAG: DUF389 domain-containing protein [Planctomycetaceae bacterium]